DLGLVLFILFFFFFQAEDGIRDATVTGVQTCALPISRSLSGMMALSVMVIPSGQTFVQHFVMLQYPMPCSLSRLCARRSASIGRSEERRVGKEGRCR